MEGHAVYDKRDRIGTFFDPYHWKLTLSRCHLIFNDFEKIAFNVFSKPFLQTTLARVPVPIVSEKRVHISRCPQL
jgi:hypothetical protein